MKNFIQKLIIAIFLFVFPPLGIFMAWKSKVFTKGIKILAIVIGILNIIMWLVNITSEEKKVELKQNEVVVSENVEKNEIKNEMVMPEYIKTITESKEDPGEYTAIITFESALSDDGTLGKTFVRLCHTLKYLQEIHPNAKWYYAEVQDSDGNLVMAGNMKQGQVNLLDKKGNIALCKAVITKANTNMNRSFREKINQFIDNNYIPMM